MMRKVVYNSSFRNSKMGELENKFNVVRTHNMDDFKKEIVDADAIITNHIAIDSEILDAAKKLKILVQPSDGVDKIDIDECTKRGVAVCNSQDLYDEVADIALFHIINCLRGCTRSNSEMKEGNWYAPYTKNREVKNSNLLVVGYGRIGKQISRRASILKMNLYAAKSTHFTEDDKCHGYTVKAIDLNEGLKIADVVVLALPLSDSTYHMFNKKTFKMMKDTASIVNIARGPIIDSEALIDALKNGDILSASLDVYEKEPIDKDDEILKMDNLFITAHIGSSTAATRCRMGDDIIDAIIDFFDGKRPKYQLNL
jgi:D-3-phosphoglycerate dehydrogenase